MSCDWLRMFLKVPMAPSGLRWVGESDELVAVSAAPLSFWTTRRETAATSKNRIPMSPVLQRCFLGSFSFFYPSTEIKKRTIFPSTLHPAVSARRSDGDRLSLFHKAPPARFSSSKATITGRAGFECCALGPGLPHLAAAVAAYWKFRAMEHGGREAWPKQ